MHRICQTVRIMTIITSGGSARAANAPSAGRMRVCQRRGFATLSRSTSAAAAGLAMLRASPFRTGMFIRCFSVDREMRAAEAARRRSHFKALDGEALEIGAGIVGIEDFAVEEGLLAARCRGRNVGGRY